MNLKNKKLDTPQRELAIRSISFFSKNICNSFFLPKLSRFINKFLYKFGVGSFINRYYSSFSLYSSVLDKSFYKSYSKKERFLNFGSGAFFHNRWTNYDYPGQSKYYKNLQGKKGIDFHPIDLTKKNLLIPENDNSISLIYCSHTLEHLDEGSAIQFLRECFRILKTNGVLRLNLPNTKNHFYLLKFILLNEHLIDNLKENYARDATRKILSDSTELEINEILNLLEECKYESQLFYDITNKKYPKYVEFDENNPERHINYFDFENLKIIGNEIGYKYIIPSYQGSSVAMPFKNIHVFDNTESQCSFYAELIK